MNNLFFDFAVDKSTKTVTVTREFKASLDLVWEAWTNPEILDQWWGPKPCVARTKRMNFEVGSSRFYAMVLPDGQERWSIQKFTSISPKTNFKMLNAFADENENPELPGSNWDLNFKEINGVTTVIISIYNESLERMERMIEMGFKEGFSVCLEQLDRQLSKK